MRIFGAQILSRDFSCEFWANALCPSFGADFDLGFVGVFRENAKGREQEREGAKPHEETPHGSMLGHISIRKFFHGVDADGVGVNAKKSEKNKTMRSKG